MKLIYHLISPWKQDVSFEFLVAMIAGFILLLTIIDLLFVLINKKYTYRKYYNIQFYSYLTIMSCLSFLMFFWYISVPLEIVIFYIAFVFYNKDMKKIFKEELDGVTGIKVFTRKKQKQDWLLKSELEKQNYLNSNVTQTIKSLNYMVLFICTYLVPIVIIVILMLFGVEYKFF